MTGDNLEQLPAQLEADRKAITDAYAAQSLRHLETSSEVDPAEIPQMLAADSDSNRPGIPI